ncbi:hypothetical protein CNMCM5878_006705 [Aspergillus fumigatiaffinis]|nr:hypothetical protein CNMCM5878_006705 [Aspergillus fumigatiaffinis]
MSGNSSPDYKALFLKAEEERKQEAELRTQEAELRRQAEEREKQQRERNRPTTFPEFIRHCHDLLWTPLRAQTLQREIYESVCRYLQPAGEDAPQLFTSLVALEDHGRRFARRPISSEQDLETYERLAVEDHVHDIVAELCKIPEAREEFRLGNGVWFDNHANLLDEDDEVDASDPSTTKPSKPDQFCIHRMDALRCEPAGGTLVQPDRVPTEEPEKSRYNAAWLVGSAIVQEFHVMIQEGLEYSYLTNGLIDVQLWMPYDDPRTLYYNLGDPGIYGMAGVTGPAWRNAAKDELPKWHSILDSDRSQIVVVDLPLDNASSDFASPEQTTSKYLTSSSPVTSGPRIAKETKVGNLAPMMLPFAHKGAFSGYSKAARLTLTEDRHPISAADLVKKLKAQLDQDLDHNCTPMGPCGSCGSSGAPFKITCSTFGYTVVGKGTTSKRWREVSRDAEVYGVLQRAQGSAVPVFPGAINLAQTYFLHGAGRIRHMLLMGWGGGSVGHTTLNKTIQRAISRSVKEIRCFGIFHHDLRPENILWNAELQRALIIDFHLCSLDPQLLHKRPGALKRLQCGPEECESKRLRVV